MSPILFANLVLIMLLAGAGVAISGTTNLINVDIGSTANIQTGAAVMGSAGDVWNGVTSSTGTIVDSTGNTLNSVSFADAGYWLFNDNPAGTVMDTATTQLMRDCVAGNTAASGGSFTVSLSGLSAYLNDPFTLVVYGGAGDPSQGCNLTLTGATGGNTTSTLAITGASRSLAKPPPNGGLGIAYQTFTGTLISDTLTITASSYLSPFYGVNGFQLQLVVPDPSISVQPDSHPVVVGQTTALSVSPVGTPPFSYQWQVTDNADGGFTNLVNNDQISGSDTRMLMINNMSTNNVLVYRVVVANRLGSVTSSPASLTLNPGALIDVDIGGGPLQTGAAVLGNADDVWNGFTGNTGTVKDSTGTVLNGVGFTMANYEGNNANDAVGSAMDPATTPLMQDYAYQSTATPINVSLTGLTSYTNLPFTLVVYAAGDNGSPSQGATIAITEGATRLNTSSAVTDGTSRRISLGNGVAYQTFTGILTNSTLAFSTTLLPGHAYTGLNGLQLQLTPTIYLTSPVSQEVYTNQTISLKVNAFGAEPLSYQWQAGQSGSNFFANLNDGSQISGSKTNILSISNMTADLALDYRVVVWNSQCAVTSSPPTKLSVLPGSLVPVVNNDFDTDYVPSGFQAMTPRGWTWNGSGSIGLIAPNINDFNSFYFGNDFDASNHSFLFSTSSKGIDNPSVSQILTTTLNSNTTYTLSVKVGNRNSGIWGGYHIALETTDGTLVGDWVGENNNIAALGRFATTSRSFTTGPNPPGLGQALVIVLEQGAPAKNSYSDFGSVLLAAKPAEPHAQGTPIDVYVCAGQSNAHGWRANPANLSLSNRHYVNAPDTRALFAYQANLVTQKNFYSQGSMGQLYTEGAGYSGYFSGFGPELSAGSDLAERFGKPLAIVKFASGGADLDTQFAKSANFLYPRLIAEVTNSLQQLIDQGYAPTVKGFFWLQGESDALLNPSTYATDIGQFVSDVRTDLNVPTLQFILTEINPNLPVFALSQAGVAQVNQAMVNLTKMDPNVKFIATGDIANGFADTVHYSANQTITIGQRWVEMINASSSHLSSP
jgi:hypothetical protein